MAAMDLSSLSLKTEGAFLQSLLLASGPTQSFLPCPISQLLAEKFSITESSFPFGNGDFLRQLDDLSKSISLLSRLPKVAATADKQKESQIQKELQNLPIGEFLAVSIDLKLDATLCSLHHKTRLAQEARICSKLAANWKQSQRSLFLAPELQPSEYDELLVQYCRLLKTTLDRQNLPIVAPFLEAAKKFQREQKYAIVLDIWQLAQNLEVFDSQRSASIGWLERSFNEHISESVTRFEGVLLTADKSTPLIDESSEEACRLSAAHKQIFTFLRQQESDPLAQVSFQLPKWSFIYHCLRSGNPKVALNFVKGNPSLNSRYFCTYFEAWITGGSLCAAPQLFAKARSDWLEATSAVSVSKDSEALYRVVVMSLVVEEGDPKDAAFSNAEDCVWFWLRLSNSKEIDQLERYVLSLRSDYFGSGGESSVMFHSLLLGLLGRWEMALEQLYRSTEFRVDATMLMIVLFLVGKRCSATPIVLEKFPAYAKGYLAAVCVHLVASLGATEDAILVALMFLGEDESLTIELLTQMIVRSRNFAVLIGGVDASGATWEGSLLRSLVERTGDADRSDQILKKVCALAADRVGGMVSEYSDRDSIFLLHASGQYDRVVAKLISAGVQFCSLSNDPIRFREFEDQARSLYSFYLKLKTSSRLAEQLLLLDIVTRAVKFYRTLYAGSLQEAALIGDEIFGITDQDPQPTGILNPISKTGLNVGDLIAMLQQCYYGLAKEAPSTRLAYWKGKSRKLMLLVSTCGADYGLSTDTFRRICNGDLDFLSIVSNQ